MSALFPPPSLTMPFMLASLALAIAPGPGVAYIVARTLRHGRRSGIASVAGIAAGNWCSALIAAAGLATIIAASATLFGAVKLAGAAYLIYLGLRALLGKDSRTSLPAEPSDAARRVFYEGFVVALLNPKTALFFAAFVPQFMVAEPRSAVQPVLLGSVFVAIAAATDTLYALLASVGAGLTTRSRGRQRIGRLVSGSVLIGLGALAALSGERPSG